MKPGGKKAAITATVMAGAVIVVAVAAGCGKGKAKLDPHTTLSTSLHATTAGMEYWYMDGLYNFTGISYEELSCKNCHAESCDACHDVDASGEPVLHGKEQDPATCYSCHGRQKIMQMKFMAPQNEADVHFARGMKCGDCHTMKEIHGDGGEWNSMLDAGFFEVRCENCHSANTEVAEHAVHAGKQLRCSTCHMRKAIACYNCHFNAEVMYDKKVAHKPISDFILLVKDRRDSRISPGTVMVVGYLTEVTDPTTFKAVAAVAPFYSHTITSAGRRCSDCHNNPAVQELVSSGKVRFTWWDEQSGGIAHLSGVIPYMEGKLEMSFTRPLTPDTAPECSERGCSYPAWMSAGVSSNMGASYMEHAIAQGLSDEEISDLASPR